MQRRLTGAPRPRLALGAARRRPRRRAGRVGRAGRRQRLRQVDAAQAPGRGHVPLRRARRRRRPGRRPDRGPGRHPPRPHRAGEHLPLRLAARAEPPRGGRAGSTRSSTSPSSKTPIDRQVKFYSSGMQMRLGFAVAAFLEPDVLLVDEVLAVGDAAVPAELPRPHARGAGPGTTLVFVSHDLRRSSRSASGPSGSRRRGRGRRPGARRARRLPAHGRAGGRGPHPGLRAGAGGQGRVRGPGATPR